MEIQQHTLPNGIRLAHYPAQTMIAHAGVFIDTGSRDELEDENGLAHFIEHVIFKGTKKRRAYQVLSRLENVGGDLNAFTTKEDTCVYASFLPEHFDRALELFADIVIHSTFPEKELKREQEVILDEINGYLDTPFEQIFDDFEARLFNGHPLGRSILGTPEQVRSFGREEVIAFMRRNYRTRDMVVCTTGPLEFRRIKRYAEKYFLNDGLATGGRPRLPVNGYMPSEKVVERKGYQTHCVVGTRAYPITHPRNMAMTLLNNILGGPGMNSRLNLSVRERHGLSYHIESGYHPYTDTGTFEVYLGTDVETLDKALGLTFREMERLRTVRLGSLQLHRARLQLKGQVAIAGDSNLNITLAMGKGILTKGHMESLEDLYARIDEVSAQDLLEVANEILVPEAMSRVIYRNP